MLLETQIINDNCWSVIENIPDKSIQCIVSSPPYNLGKTYEDKKHINEYLDAFNINEFYRILKDEGSIFWQVGNYVSKGEIIPLDILFYDLFKNNGFKLRNRIIWHFEHGLHCKKRFSGRYEVIMWFTKTDNYIFNLDSVRIPQKYPGKKYFKGPRKGQLSCNPLGKSPGDVWNIVNIKHNHPEKTDHPCQFPIELCKKCILVGSNIGDVILDPFCGSGTTVLTAEMYNRVGIGIDKIKEYCVLTENRLNEYKTNYSSS